jgi:putative restriction endonuclease
MAKGIFMSGVDPKYDDLPEVRYHFPKRYLRLAEQCVGDWILYYEPRNNAGRMCYYATARVNRIERDPAIEDHFYAYVTDYLEFPNPVPYRRDGTTYESRLSKEDGSINMGLLGWAVHHLADIEYQMIVTAGMCSADTPATPEDAAAEDGSPFLIHERPIEEVICRRPMRERAFSIIVKSAYNNTCAITGLHLINGGGRAEVDAAHIMAVENAGPDSPRNGLALSKTVHWMFDRGLISLEDDGRILRADSLIPDQLKGLFNVNGYAILPDQVQLKPHRQFLRFHRETRFKG